MLELCLIVQQAMQGVRGVTIDNMPSSHTMHPLEVSNARRDGARVSNMLYPHMYHRLLNTRKTRS